MSLFLWIDCFSSEPYDMHVSSSSYDMHRQDATEYPGRCNILCGRNHAQMLFTVKVVTLQEYQTYIQGLVAEEKAAIA